MTLSLKALFREKTGAYIVELTSASAGDYQMGAIDKGQIFQGRIANEPDNTLADALTQTVSSGRSRSSGRNEP